MADQVEKLRVAQLERAKPRRSRRQWLRRAKTGGIRPPAPSSEPLFEPPAVFESYAVTFQPER